MASISQSHFLLFTILLSTTILVSNVVAQNKPQTFQIPIKKNTQTLQYYASLRIGTPPIDVDAVLDLGGRFLSLACDKFKSSTRRSFPCAASEYCQTVSNSTTCGPNDTCSVTAFNPFNKNSVLTGVLTEDVVKVHSANNGTVTGVLTSSYSSNLSLSCVKSGNLVGLAKGSNGILGLGKSSELRSMSLPWRLALTNSIPLKFALCLPSSNSAGELFIGGVVPELSQEISFTLIVSSAGSEYYVYVNSIKIDKRVVHFDTSLLNINQNGVGGTEISTATPYGILHTAIYNAVVGDFVKRAGERNLTQVAAVAPFGACFSTKGVRWTKGGPRVPMIELALPGNMAVWTWKIHGANSMVRVNKDVMCLGFVDGGTNGAAIVLGGHTLEDNYLEFDMTRSVLGFTSSLLPQGKSCANYRNI